MSAYTLTLSRAEHGLLLHALLDQILRRGKGGLEVYHDVVSREDATPEDLLVRVQGLHLDDGPLHDELRQLLACYPIYELLGGLLEVLTDLANHEQEDSNRLRLRNVIVRLQPFGFERQD